MAAIYTLVNDVETGQTRYHRTRTTEVEAILDVMTVRRALLGERRTEYLKALEKLTIYIDPDTCCFYLLEQPNTIPVKLAVRKQYRGERLFWVCPLSGEKVYLLYLVNSASGPVIGSRKALGLVYPSQALHRTLAFDNAVLSGKLKTLLPVFVRASLRQQTRNLKALILLVRKLG